MQRRSPHAATWGRRIKDSRRAIPLTQAQLAVAVGVNQVTVSRWEAGAAAPSDIYRARLARLLGVDVTWLFSYVPTNGNDVEAA